MLADDTALAHVGRGPGGLVETLPQGGVHIAMGTHQIAAIEELARAHAAAGPTLVAAPVLGRPEMAAAGLLGLIAGGPADTLARVQPLLDDIGAPTLPSGPQPPLASLLQLANTRTENRR